MDKTDERALEILRELGSRPAAPFFEDGPASYIVETIGKLGVDVRRDEFGNVQSLCRHHHSLKTAREGRWATRSQA